MLSRPMGLPQHGAGELVRLITSESISVPACGFTTVAKAPKVCGWVADTENTTVEPSRPVNLYGIVVVLEYRSTELKRNVAPPAVMVMLPVLGPVPAAASK